MKTIDRDNLPHLILCLQKILKVKASTFFVRVNAWWWMVSLGSSCVFNGFSRFRRHPNSKILIGDDCKFNSSPMSNYIGVNRPCILATLQEGAHIQIGSNSGFSGTVIGCAKEIIIGDHVMCGANTLITDTDWHSDDPRSGPDKPVIIEDGVWLGVNVTVLKGVTIGENTLVAAGSVVVDSLPADVVAGGVPARVLKQIDTNKKDSV